MKKFLVLIVAVAVLVAMTVPAQAQTVTKPITVTHSGPVVTSLVVEVSKDGGVFEAVDIGTQADLSNVTFNYAATTGVEHVFRSTAVAIDGQTRQCLSEPWTPLELICEGITIGG